MVAFRAERSRKRKVFFLNGDFVSKRVKRLFRSKDDLLRRLKNRTKNGSMDPLIESARQRLKKLSGFDVKTDKLRIGRTTLTKAMRCKCGQEPTKKDGVAESVCLTLMAILNCEWEDLRHPRECRPLAVQKRVGWIQKSPFFSRECRRLLQQLVQRLSCRDILLDHDEPFGPVLTFAVGVERKQGCLAYVMENALTDSAFKNRQVRVSEWLERDRPTLPLVFMDGQLYFVDWISDLLATEGLAHFPHWSWHFDPIGVSEDFLRLQPLCNGGKITDATIDRLVDCIRYYSHAWSSYRAPASGSGPIALYDSLFHVPLLVEGKLQKATQLAFDHLARTLGERVCVIEGVHLLFSANVFSEAFLHFIKSLPPVVRRRLNPDFREELKQYWEDFQSQPDRHIDFSNVANANRALADMVLFRVKQPRFPTEFVAKTTHQFGRLARLVSSDLLLESFQRGVDAIDNGIVNETTMRHVLYCLYGLRNCLDVKAEKSICRATVQLVRQLPNLQSALNQHLYLWTMQVARFNAGRFGDEDSRRNLEDTLNDVDYILQDAAPLFYYYGLKTNEFATLKAHYTDNLLNRNGGRFRDFTAYDFARIDILEREYQRGRISPSWSMRQAA